MLNSLRGIMLAASAAALPLTVHAECPPEGSIDRYAETARDALSALDGLVPESQQATLEDRYTALLVMKWEWQGGNSVASDPGAVSTLADCMASGRCQASTSDLISSNSTVVPNAPSPVLLYWAQTELECEAVIPEELALEEEEEASEDEETELAELEPNENLEPAETEASDETLPTEPTTTLAAYSPPAVPARPDLSDEEVVDTELMMQTAATMFATGRPGAAIEPLRTACIYEAKRMPASQACDTLFGVVSAQNGELSYLALSDELCSLGYSRGCQNLARHYSEQDTVEGRMATVAYTEKSCGLGDGEACAVASEYYLTGRADAPNPALAREKLEQSCLLGRLRSCREAADFYLRGVGGDVSVDRALLVNEASCPASDAARPDICVAAADFVLIHMPAGPDRRVLVRQFTERACAIGHDRGCAMYAEDLELGLGGDVDLAAAKKARGIACEYGHLESCKNRS